LEKNASPNQDRPPNTNDSGTFLDSRYNQYNSSEASNETQSKKPTSNGRDIQESIPTNKRPLHALADKFENRKRSYPTGSDNRYTSSGNLHEFYESGNGPARQRSGLSFSKMAGMKDDLNEGRLVCENSSSSGNNTNPLYMKKLNLNELSNSNNGNRDSNKMLFDHRRKSDKPTSSKKLNSDNMGMTDAQKDHARAEMKKKLRLNLPAEKPTEGFHDEFMKNFDSFSLSWRMKMLEDKTFHLYNPNQNRLD
jgi:hypothetical protein